MDGTSADPLLPLDSVTAHILKLVDHISELENTILLDLNIEWNDLLAKFSVLSLELNQLESYLSDKQIKSHYSSILLEPARGADHSHGAWHSRNAYFTLVPNVLFRTRPLTEQEEETDAILADELKGRQNLGTSDIFSFDPILISGLLGQFGEKIKEHDNYFISLINQLDESNCHSRPTTKTRHLPKQTIKTHVNSSLFISQFEP